MTDSYEFGTLRHISEKVKLIHEINRTTFSCIFTNKIAHTPSENAPKKSADFCRRLYEAETTLSAQARHLSTAVHTGALSLPEPRYLVIYMPFSRLLFFFAPLLPISPLKGLWEKRAPQFARARILIKRREIRKFSDFDFIRAAMVD